MVTFTDCTSKDEREKKWKQERNLLNRLTTDSKKSELSKQVQKLLLPNAVKNIDMKIEATTARQLSNDGYFTKSFFIWTLKLLQEVTVELKQNQQSEQNFLEKLQSPKCIG